jgi:diguanylate cyclase (GGDEF)-like protein
MKKLLALVLSIAIGLISTNNNLALAAEIDNYSKAAKIFEVNCAGCHPNGGNIIRRGKNLKQKALQKNKMDSIESIAELVTHGKNNMSAFDDRLSQEGLLNRKEFERQLAKTIATAKINRTTNVVCYLDLDRFKWVNDTCSHLAGDALLLQVTAILEKQLRPQDILARLSADEFGLLLDRCTLEQAKKIVNSIEHSLKNLRFSWGEKVFSVGVSIGLVAIDADNQNLKQVLSAVDAACNLAKEKGRNCIHIYSKNDRELTKQRQEREWITKINRALEENRFCLYYQKITPITAISNKEHYEVLVRLLSETGKLILPMNFLPAAERYDLMPAIDRWVISNFLTMYAKYCQKRSQQGISIHNEIYTINLSGASFNDEQFLDFLIDRLAQAKIPSQNICFEITETVAIANLTKASKLIKALKKIGISFALDDFGSGMSSLNYLKNLPVDYLKIDGSFVKNLVNDPFNTATVECFNRIGHVMNILTIAEFVEDEITLEKLRDLGVDYGQGYAIGKPQPLSFA